MRLASLYSATSVSVSKSGAYFLKLKELDNDFDKLWEYHLEGLLREYLRGMEDAEKSLVLFAFAAVKVLLL